MNDIILETQHLVTLLAPLLPYLTSDDDKAGQEARQKLGTDAWNSGKSVWDRLRPEIESRTAAHEAVNDASLMPGDADALAAFRLQLKKLLAENEVLANDLSELLKQAPSVPSQITQVGDRNVVVGGSVHGNFIVTGDRNIVKTFGKPVSFPSSSLATDTLLRPATETSPDIGSVINDK